MNPLVPNFTCKAKQRQHCGHLYGSSIGLVINQAAQHAPLMVITPDSLSAQRLLEEIQFYAHKDLPLLLLPDWESLPYDLFSPHQDIISERLTTLYHLPGLKRGVLILPVNTLMSRIAPTDYVTSNSLCVNTGQLLNSERLQKQLKLCSYRFVEQVVEHGECAVHGHLFDLFPMGSEMPYRIELWDEEVVSIRSFDPDTQRTISTIKDIRLLPAREFPLTQESIQQFRTQWRTRFKGEPTQYPMYQDVTTGFAPGGIEYYLPLFFEHTHTLFDYLPHNSLVITLANVLETAEQFWQDITERYDTLQVKRPILPPSDVFLQANQIFAKIRQYPHLDFSQEDGHQTGALNFETAPPPSLPIDARILQPLSALQAFLKDKRVLIAAETIGRRESLLRLLDTYQLKPQLVADWQEFLDSDYPFCLTVSPLEQGLVLSHLAVISERQLFGERVEQRRWRNNTKQNDSAAQVNDLTELNIGAPVVHETHGVGRYRGLIVLNIGNIEAEFLHLEYAKQDTLYVPISSLYLISRFTGMDAEHAPLHRLGNPRWHKAKQKAAEKAQDVAAELLDIYARRAVRQGHVFKVDQTDYQAFAQAFPFEETPDQQEAIEAVLENMYSTRPMDRLICGDVGFGKTEVAMRAAFVAVQDGQQVAVLVPTTLLAQQHYQTFQDRFADWAIRIDQLSRFRSGKQLSDTLKAVAGGQSDIVIGTHKLLQDNITFKNLGLVIIDEEHRFGVKQKERFKSLRSEVDLLTLTATPIPRSLNMALSNLRDLSVITTPPARRLAIKTFVSEWHGSLISEAILRELKRGGQVYFLHNDIDSMRSIVRDIEKLVPQARVQFAHGKMRERELEQVMQDFYHRRFNVLVCTTIIETGIDIPTANTIIINRADKLGLAQLYQLRGRVGRSHHRAYAYLIIPDPKAMTQEAQKRIDAISALKNLGMGFTLAQNDLEIRGAGELLGGNQSGHIQEIGYHLYTELLERAVKALKSGQKVDLERPLSQSTEINLHSPALLPSTYMPDVHIRLIFYKRIANAANLHGLDEIHVELIDRFGLLPEYAKALIKITELKLKATPLGIRKIDFGTGGGYMLFDEKTTIEPLKIFNMIQKEASNYKLEGQNKLRLLLELSEFSERCQALETVLACLV